MASCPAQPSKCGDLTPASQAVTPTIITTDTSTSEPASGGGARNTPEGVQQTAKSYSSSLADMEQMRREIRQLQEKRSAAMMNEVVELQRERDTAVGRVKILKQTLEGIHYSTCLLVL